jgi:hypothetical protein
VLGPYRLIIVQRDRIGVFRTLLASGHRWPAGTAIMLDRRYGERRVRAQQMLTERRQRLRRADLPAQWYTQGFTIVEVATLPSQAAILRPWPATALVAGSAR